MGGWAGRCAYLSVRTGRFFVACGSGVLLESMKVDAYGGGDKEGI